MDAVFQLLKSSGLMSVDKLIGFLKDAKIIDGLKVHEEKIRGLFGKAGPTAEVGMEKFKDIVNQCAKDSGKGVEDITKFISNQAQGKTTDAIKDAVSGATSSGQGAANALENVAGAAKDKLKNLF